MQLDIEKRRTKTEQNNCFANTFSGEEEKGRRESEDVNWRRATSEVASTYLCFLLTSLETFYRVSLSFVAYFSALHEGAVLSFFVIFLVICH